MKSRLRCLAFSLLLVSPLAVKAADLAVKSPRAAPVAAADYDWTGFPRVHHGRPNRLPPEVRATWFVPSPDLFDRNNPNNPRSDWPGPPAQPAQF